MRLTSVGDSGRDQFVEQSVRDRAAVLVVAKHSPQRLLLPNPVLEHLRGHLHEVGLHQGSAEFGESGLRRTKKTKREEIHALSF